MTESNFQIKYVCGIAMEKPTNLAIMVAVSAPKSRPEETEEHLDEMAFLAETIGIATIQRFAQKLPNPDVRTFVGKGKLEEIKSFVTSHDVRYVLFDDDLSPFSTTKFGKRIEHGGRNAHRTHLRPFAAYPRYFFDARSNSTSSHTGGVGNESVSVTAPHQDVDAPGTTAWR